jgi:hypothetical protein
MPHRLRHLFFLLLLAPLAACGQRVEPRDGSDPPTDAAADTPAGDAPPQNWRRTSSVRVSLTDPALIAHWGRGGGGILGLFYEAPWQPETQFTVRQEGACRIVRWRSYALANAGTLTVAGRGAPITVMPDDPTFPVYSETVEAGQWIAGERLTISVSGETVPAFSTSLVFPPAVVVDAPALPAPDASLSLRLTDPLRVQWHGGAPPLVEVSLSSSVPNPPGTAVVNIKCRYSGGAGAAVVPATVLAELAGGYETLLSVLALDLRTLQAGPFPVEIGASYVAYISPVTVE